MNEEILTEVPTTSSAPSTNLASWLETVHNASKVGPSSKSHLLNEDQLKELYGDQIKRFYHIDQQMELYDAGENYWWV